MNLNYNLIWENYYHINDMIYDITYTAAASSAAIRQNKSLF